MSSEMVFIGAMDFVLLFAMVMFTIPMHFIYVMRIV